MSVDAITHVMDFELSPALKLAAVSVADNYGFEAIVRSDATYCVLSGLNCSPENAESAVAHLIEIGVLECVSRAETKDDDEIRIKSNRHPGREKHTQAQVSSKTGALPRSKGFVYLLENEARPNIYKIGRTRNPESRRETFGVLLPFDVEYVCLVATADMFALERELHDRFADKRINGEWFSLTPDDVSYIKSIGGDA